MAFSFKGLLVCGGQSSRMGTSKALLKHADGQPLYVRNLALLSKVCSECFISIRREQQDGLRSTLPEGVQLIMDEHTNIGPAAALLAAYNADPNATWFVLAVDFPLLSIDALMHLAQHYKPPVTCYLHEDGNPEPLFSIWSPDALKALQSNVNIKKTGPCFTIRQVLGDRSEKQPKDVSKSHERMSSQNHNVDRIQPTLPNYILPQNVQWLFNANTPQEWQTAQSYMARTRTPATCCEISLALSVI